MNKKESINVTITSSPVDVSFECPICYHENCKTFKEFDDSQGNPDYWGEWKNATCESCGEEFEINNVEYD